MFLNDVLFQLAKLKKYNFVLTFIIALATRLGEIYEKYSKSHAEIL